MGALSVVETNQRMDHVARLLAETPDMPMSVALQKAGYKESYAINPGGIPWLHTDEFKLRLSIYRIAKDLGNIHGVALAMMYGTIADMMERDVAKLFSQDKDGNTEFSKMKSEKQLELYHKYREAQGEHFNSVAPEVRERISELISQTKPHLAEGIESIDEARAD